MKILEWKDKFTGKDMYDYRTGNITGDNIFDITKTGMSYYNSLLPGSGEEEYFKNNKNLYGQIINLTPQQYFEACVQYAFPNSSVDKLKAERSRDKDSLQTIETVINNDVQLPITVINAAQQTQEGLHRMYVVGEMFGWNNKKYPVLFIDYYDKDRQKQWEEQAKIIDIEDRIEDAVKETCRYNFSNMDEFLDELQWKLNSSFRFYPGMEDKDVPFDYEDKGETLTIKVLDVPYTFDTSLIKIVQKENEDEDNFDWDDIDIDDIDWNDDINNILNKYIK